MAVASGIIVLVKFILVLAKKRKTYKGSKQISLAQLFKLAPIAAVIPMLVSPIGVTKPLGIIFAAASAICAVFAAIAVVSDVTALCSKADNKAKAWRYILNIIWNVMAVATVLVFEMYQFWGC
jgi:hypothetical protein